MTVYFFYVLNYLFTFKKLNMPLTIKNIISKRTKYWKSLSAKCKLKKYGNIATISDDFPLEHT